MNDPRQIYAELANTALAASGRTSRRPIEFMSQAGEDLAVWNFLGRPLNGFYIEVGAFNGRDYSVTYALDAMGWNGLLIEAIPERYQECVRNRPDARVVHAALGPPGQRPTTMLTVTDDQVGGMLSYVGIGAVQRFDIVKGKRKVEVPFTTMDALLAEHQGDIDLAVIDVEGFEIPLLQGFNLKKHRPKLLLIEDVEQSNAKGLTRITKYMESQGYRTIGDVTNNNIYARADLAIEFGKNGYGRQRT